MNKFQPEKGNISRIKAHVVYTKPNKKKERDYDESIKVDEFDIDKPSWEFHNVKNFAQGNIKGKIEVDKYFDTKNDGKPFKKKKETPHYKKKKPFYMVNGIKKFHEI